MPLFPGDRLGLSSACHPGLTLDEAAQRGHELGFRTFEMLAFDGYRHSQGILRGFYFEHMTARERDDLRAIADRFDHVSTHAPFIDMTPLAPNPSVRETAVRQLEIAIEAVAFLGGTTTTACTWSGRTFSSITSTRFRSHIVLTFASTSFPTSPVRIR